MDRLWRRLCTCVCRLPALIVHVSTALILLSLLQNPAYARHNQNPTPTPAPTSTPAPTPDPTPTPIGGVYFSTPAPNSTVGGTINVTCADSLHSNAWVDISLDGAQEISSSSPTGTWSWNTANSSSGAHTLTCQGYYWTSGPVLDGTASEIVTVSNSAATPTPTVTLTPTPTPASTPTPTPAPTSTPTPSGALGFLVPMTSQTLYTGTIYSIVAQAIGATTVKVSDQTGSTLPCTFNSSSGLVICTYAPSIVGLNTLTLISGGSAVSRQFNVVKPSGIYPQGDKMMVGAYDGYDNSSGTIFTNYVGDSFNFSQEYCSTCLISNQTSFADAAHGAGLAGAAGYLWNNNCFTPFGSGNGGVAGCESEIVGMAPDPNIVFWGLPEENYFSNYLTSDATLYSFIHSNDTSRRPVFKYWLSGMPYNSIQPNVANVDIIGEGEYPMDDGCSWQGSPYPNVFARWVVEQEIQAIQSAGYVVGPNYSSGQKTPILIPETVTAGTYCNTAGTSGADISNQLWNGLAAGAKGYFDFLWEEYVVAGNMTGAATAMATVNNLLVGQEGIGEWMLKGTRQSDLTTNVLVGPSGNVGVSGTRTFSYPPIRAAVWDWAGTRVIVAINSSTSAITAAISGLPAGVPDATVVNEGRSVSITGGSFSDYFSGQGVHVYKIPLVSQQSSGSWVVLP